MIRTKISAVTSVTYGLLSALIIAVIVGGLSAAGIGVENVFSAAGNGIVAIMVPPNPIGTPNSELTTEQQSEITNAAAEIAAGTASAACLQYMNNATNAASMASNNATCLGPGLNIAPPQQPISVFADFPFGEPVYTYQDGQIYTIAFAQGGNGTSLNTQGVWFYNDGFVANNFNDFFPCSADGVSPSANISASRYGTSNYSYWYTPSTVTTTQGSSVSCTGGVAIAGVVNGLGTKSAPLGYSRTNTW